MTKSHAVPRVAACHEQVAVIPVTHPPIAGRAVVRSRYSSAISTIFSSSARTLLSAIELGLSFEMFDDFGRYRTEESLEHPDNLLSSGDGKSTFDRYTTAPVVTTGELTGAGAGLDGEFPDALEMIDRLARADRVRQSMIRHAFRFFLGRNEMPSDSPALIDADRAYLDSNGSFKAVVVSLLTSDAFLYRKELQD